MRSIRTLALIASLIGLFVSEGAAAYTLVSREHRFSIELPGEPDYHGPRTIFLGDNEYTGLGWD